MMVIPFGLMVGVIVPALVAGELAVDLIVAVILIFAVYATFSLKLAVRVGAGVH